MMAVDVTARSALSLGKPRLLFERHFKNGREADDYDVGPDGQRFVMIEEGEPAPAPTELVLVQNWAEELKRLVPMDD